MKTRLSTLLLSAAMFGLTACSVNDEPVVTPETPENSETTDDPQQPEPDYASVRCDVPVFVSYNIQSEVRTSLESYLTNITSIDEAEVAVIKAEDIGAYEDKLKDLYDRGGLVVVAQPTGGYFQDFAEKYDIPNLMPIESTQPVLLFATDNKYRNFVLYANGPSGDELTYYKRRIFEFFRWIKQHRTQTRAAQWIATYDPYVFFTECEHIFHNFEAPMEHGVIKVWPYSEDKLNVTSSIDVNYQIYTAYLFEGAASPSGDYYIVTRDITVHNSDSYQPYDKWHDAIKVSVVGYYMYEFDVTSKLKDSSGSKDLSGTVFAKEPTPSTTTNSTSYTSGISLELNGAIASGSSLGFTGGYQNSTTREISDLQIMKVTDSNTRSVTHQYIVENTFNGLDPGINVWDDYTKIEKKIPLIARSDFDATSEWCWLIPTGTNSVGDNETTKFDLYTSYKLNYGCRVSSSVSSLYDDTHKYSEEGAFYHAISAPKRQPFGIMALQNAHDNTIGKIRIWKQGEQGDETKIFYSLGHSVFASTTEDIALPVGTYYVEYSQLDGNNNVLSTWKLENVSLHSGNTRDTAATITSTENSTLIE